MFGGFDRIDCGNRCLLFSDVCGFDLKSTHVITSMKKFYTEHSLLLAPMAGVSDEVFRSLCIDQGASLTYTEMVSAKGLSYANEKTQDLLLLAPNEKIIAVQLFGNEPAVLADEAAWIEEHLGTKLAYIDINMGCPAKKIVRKGDGCALMKTPDLAARIVYEVAQAVKVPVTVKFRRGFNLDDETAVPFAKLMESAGAQSMTVHGRYAEQYYRGKADWGVIARVKEAVSVPVVGNGDIKSGEDVLALLKETSCDAFMIARAAQGNPWIFAEANMALKGESTIHPPSATQRIAMARRHAKLLAQRGGRTIVRMRKHAMWYLTGLPGATAARAKINDCIDLADFDRVFDELIERSTKD